MIQIFLVLFFMFIFWFFFSAGRRITKKEIAEIKKLILEIKKNKDV